MMIFARAKFSVAPLVRLAAPRSLHTAELQAKADLYRKQGYVVIPHVVQQEDAEEIKGSFNAIMKNIAEMAKEPTLSAMSERDCIKDLYMYYSNGKKVVAATKISRSQPRSGSSSWRPTFAASLATGSVCSPMASTTVSRPSATFPTRRRSRGSRRESSA